MFGINKNLKLHFIGIGGIGMSGIAKVLMNLGYQVSGSDLSNSPTVEKLQKNGAEIFIGHKIENVKDVQIVVYSSAIDESNPEIIEARNQKVPLIKRAEMLAELMRLKYGIAIAGSHGKTTTTSLLATILNKLEFKPTYIIGGLVKNLEDNAQIGDGELLVAEADESDGSFCNNEY
jgi:UDP-N-acetylmuramate--alanine ligase